MREALGSLAGSQYRSGGLDPALSLLLSEDPEDYLRKASVLDRIGVHQTAELRKLRGTLRSLSQDRAEASKRLGALERSRKAAATHKRTVEHKLAEAHAAAQLPPGRRTRRLGPRLPLRPHRPPRARRRPRLGPRGRRRRRRPLRPRQALRVGRQRPLRLRLLRAHPVGVRAGRGRPAAHLAGPAVRRLLQVLLSEARPGDLVLYRADASHVAMYMGNGQVIHAPYPGAPVRYDPVGMMPVSSVTRV